MKKKNIFNIKGRKILVFGASGLLGEEYVKYLISQDAVVCAIDKNISSLKKKFNSKAYNFKNLFFFTCDITKIQKVKSCFKIIQKKN